MRPHSHTRVVWDSREKCSILLAIPIPVLADQIHANHPRQPFLAAKAKRKDADTSRQRGRSWGLTQSR
jgi:hypothetical protein